MWYFKLLGLNSIPQPPPCFSFLSYSSLTESVRQTLYRASLLWRQRSLYLLFYCFFFGWYLVDLYDPIYKFYKYIYVSTRVFFHSFQESIVLLLPYRCHHELRLSTNSPSTTHWPEGSHYIPNFNLKIIDTPIFTPDRSTSNLDFVWRRSSVLIIKKTNHSHTCFKFLFFTSPYNFPNGIYCSICSFPFSKWPCPLLLSKSLNQFRDPSFCSHLRGDSWTAIVTKLQS